MTTRQLLLVEDDHPLAVQTARALENRGNRVHVAHNEAEFRALLNQLTQLDGAILDQNLGDDNGLELIAPILTRFPDCRVILL
ncbi:MAG: response regulator, partial [Pseudomonadota bacterium]|nr:response regulator [Pseudomonadota bacterium]